MSVPFFSLASHSLQELIELIVSKESELEVAVDEEDYDRAAELSETIDASKESLKLVCLFLPFLPSYRPCCRSCSVSQ